MDCLKANFASGVAGLIAGIAVGYFYSVGNEGANTHPIVRLGVPIGSNAICDTLQSTFSGFNLLYLIDDIAGLPSMYIGIRLGNKLFRGSFAAFEKLVDYIYKVRHSQNGNI